MIRSTDEKRSVFVCGRRIKKQGYLYFVLFAFLQTVLTELEERRRYRTIDSIIDTLGVLWMPNFHPL